MANALDLLFFLGRPFSPIYGLAMKIRAGCYQRGLLRQGKLGVPIISVGNLVLGGTGKTPLVCHIARLLQNLGYRPAIVSRGYRGRASAPVNIVSDGRQVLLSPRQAGDEPFLLANSLPGIAVLTGRRRILPARAAIELFQADSILLDDGFQHIDLGRDIDLVLFDGSALAGNSRIFPGGPLREPISALRRCHAFVITGTTARNARRAELFAELLQQRFPHAPVFFSQFDRPRIVAPDGAVLTDLNDTRRYFAFCGIANPQRFNHSLEELALPLAGFWALADHQHYSSSRLAAIAARAQAAGADRLITTAKDFVKLADALLPLPLYRLEVDQKVDSRFDIFLGKSLAGR